jgi:hypothetical protein
MKRAGLLRWALATSVAGLVVASGAPAQATAYRYWSYWLGSDGAWTYANAGPAFRIPTDGTVEGWRFSVDGGGGGLPPRTSADFDTVCAGTPVQEGLKRVAVIVDPGSVEDAPPGQSPPGAWALCVSAVDKATGYDVLRAAASVRVEAGLICAIGSYPTGECAVVVGEPEPKPKPSPSPEPKPTKTREPKPQPTNTTSGPAAEPTGAPTTPSSSTTTPNPGGSAETSASPENTVSPSTTSTPTATPTPPPTPTSSETSIVAAAPADVPSPSVSLLAEPLADPDDSGGGSLLMTGGAVAGIALLGGAAVIVTRRRSL